MDVCWMYVEYVFSRSQWWRNYWSVLWKELLKTNQQELRIEKVIKRKGGKVYVKSKGYDSSFNSWLNKKDLRCDYNV